MNESVLTLLVYALPVIAAITLHEAAHAWAARLFGDNTAFDIGRMSINPARHIDPFGTLLLPAMLYMVNHTFLFGYAKPVPITISRLRKPRLHMALVALAGPAANFVSAFVWIVLAQNVAPDVVAQAICQAGIRVNLVLFALNLLPIPPLDGSRVLASCLPPRLARQYSRLEPYGIWIVLALSLLYSRIIQVPLHFIIDASLQLLGWLAAPLPHFLN